MVLQMVNGQDICGVLAAWKLASSDTVDFALTRVASPQLITVPLR